MSQEFMDAAIQGSVAKVKEMLLDNPGLARSKDEKGLSVILKAAYYGKRDVVAALLESGASLDIFEAAALGKTEKVKALLKDDSSLVNAYSVDGFMPLGLATFFGHRETVETLLAAGAPVNAPSRESMKMNALGSAMAAERTDIARILIDHGADVNAKAENELTPLHTAAARGNMESAMLLLDQGADINAMTADGKTPLAYAEERNHPGMVDFLQNRAR
jgi:ankyrin repeat protein